MNKFLSNDRKVILKSAAAGVGIISLLALLAIPMKDCSPLGFLAVVGAIIVYWFIPICFSFNRQLTKKETKYFTSDGIEIYGPTIPEYKYFNVEGKEVKKRSNRKKDFVFISLIITNLLLIFLVYPNSMNILIYNFLVKEKVVIWLWALFTLSTPYLTRHVYCFVINLPMDTSVSFNANGPAYIHKYDDSRANNQYIHRYDSNRSFSTNPVYSSLSCNIYNHRR